MTFSDSHYIKFSKMVKHDDGCWIWQGKLTTGNGRGTQDGGYANVSWLGINGGHRISYSMFNGPIPSGMTVDHACLVRSCVNPDHLRLKTPAENIALSYAAIGMRTATCPAGHSDWKYRRDGSRYCAECARQWARKRYQKAA